MTKRYVEQQNGTYRIAGTRLSLDSVVYAFREGQSAEDITRSFPLLSLEQTYGAIAFYLANRAMIDDYLARGEEDYETFRLSTQAQDPAFHRRLATERRRRLAS